MWSTINLRAATLIASIVLVSVTTAAQSSPNSIPSQTKKERKAQARQDRIVREEQAVAVAEAGATSTSRLALPFKRAWLYLTDEASTVPPSTDATRIYLPLTGGRILCLDRETGSLLWSSEPGGMIGSSIAVGKNSIFLATRKTTENGSEAGASLRALDKATGLTLWLKDYQRPFTSPLALAGDRIYAGSADGSLYALDSNNGEVIWKVETDDVVEGRALVTDNAIYFGSDDGALRAIERTSGKQIWKHQASGKIVGQPSSDEHAVYFGGGDGYAYSVDIATGKLKWRARTGAAIEASPVLTGDRVLVASFDNFVYALSRATGGRIWKRRLENRITSAPLIEGDASLIAPLRGDYVAVFLNSDGRRVNLYQLDKEFEIVADPIFSNETLVLATNKGLVVATATRPAANAPSAVKK